MKGLLYKEFLSLKKYLNALGLLLVLYFGIRVYSREVSFFAGFSAMAAVIVTFSAFTYDNYANWDRYALSLPLSRKNLVQGRYLFALIIVAVCLILNLVCGGIILLFSQEPISLLIYSSLAVAGVSLLLISLIMPIAFRFGVDRGRIYAVVIALCIVGAMVAAQNYLYALDRLIAMLDRLLPLVPFLLAAVVFISYRLSGRICSKKEY